MITVVKMQGKGEGNKADYISFHQFKEPEECNKFISENTSKGKYWSYCEIVMDGEQIEPYAEFY